MIHNESETIVLRNRQTWFWHFVPGTGIVCTPETSNADRTIVFPTKTVSLTAGPRSFGTWNGYVYKKAKPLTVSRAKMKPLTVTFARSITPCSGDSAVVDSDPTPSGTVVSVELDKFDETSYTCTVVKSKAQQACLDQISEVAGNLAVSMMEGKKSWNQIWGAARTIAKALRLVKRGRVRDAWQTLAPRLPFTQGLPAERGNGRRNLPRRTWQEDWMAMRYGWGPMMKDAADVASVFAQRFTSRPLVYSASARASLGNDLTFIRGKAGTASANILIRSRIVNEVMSGPGSLLVKSRDLIGYSSRASLTVAVTSPGYLTFNQMFGNPLSTLYELTTLSWMVDWFADISAYLRNMTALQGLTVLDGYTTDETQRRIETYASGSTSGDWQVVLRGFGTVDTTSYSRQPWSGVVPFTVGKSAINGLSWQQAITSIALLRLALR